MDKLHIKCNKILPLVYDDSLSYYEVLCKVVAKLNELISDVNDNMLAYMIENWNSLFLDIAYIEETETIVLTLASDESEDE